MTRRASGISLTACGGRYGCGGFSGSLTGEENCRFVARVYGQDVDWVVENNVVITDHWHGISLYGADNARLPAPPLLMFSRITNITDNGGAFGKGQVLAVGLALAGEGVFQIL